MEKAISKIKRSKYSKIRWVVASLSLLSLTLSGFFIELFLIASKFRFLFISSFAILFSMALMILMTKRNQKLMIYRGAFFYIVTRGSKDGAKFLFFANEEQKNNYKVYLDSTFFAMPFVFFLSHQMFFLMKYDNLLDVNLIVSAFLSSILLFLMFFSTYLYFLLNFVAKFSPLFDLGEKI